MDEISDAAWDAYCQRPKAHRYMTFGDWLSVRARRGYHDASQSSQGRATDIEQVDVISKAREMRDGR